jgi:hypothetical protein
MQKASYQDFEDYATDCVSIEAISKIFEEFPMTFRKNKNIIKEILSSISIDNDMSLTSEQVSCLISSIIYSSINYEDLIAKKELYDEITYSNYKPGEIGFDEFEKWKKKAVNILKSGVRFTYEKFFKTSIDTMRFVMDLGIDFLEETDEFQVKAILSIDEREEYLDFIDFLSEKGIRIFIPRDADGADGWVRRSGSDEYEGQWFFSQLHTRKMYYIMTHLLEKSENDINYVSEKTLRKLLEISSRDINDSEESVKHEKKVLKTRKKIFKLYDFNIKKRRLPLLRKSIKESFNKKEFVWQEVCSQLNKEGTEYLKKIANELLIVDVEGKNKRELCKLISNEMMDAVESCEDTNLLGDELNKLPGWRIYKIKSKCYDILDLKEILDTGETRNPFTREQLPVEDIKQRIKLLINIKGTLDRKNFLKDVKESQIFSKETYLLNQIVKLYSNFPYMLEPTLISLATDSQIDQMTEDLFQTDANDVFKVTRQEILNIRGGKGVEKKIKFTELLLRVSESDDNNVLLYLAFLYFSKIKKGQDTTDDQFFEIIRDRD